MLCCKGSCWREGKAGSVDAEKGNRLDAKLDERGCTSKEQRVFTELLDLSQRTRKSGSLPSGRTGPAEGVRGNAARSSTMRLSVS
jgi:hypothetical protein